MRGPNRPEEAIACAAQTSDNSLAPALLDELIEGLEALLMKLDDAGLKEAAISLCHSIDLLVKERDKAL